VIVYFFQIEKILEENIALVVASDVIVKFRGKNNFQLNKMALSFKLNFNVSKTKTIRNLTNAELEALLFSKNTRSNSLLKLNSLISNEEAGIF